MIVCKTTKQREALCRNTLTLFGSHCTPGYWVTSTITYRSFAKFDEIAYLADLRGAPFSEVYNHTDPDDALNTWYSIFNNILERHAPQKKKRIKYPVKPEWLTLEYGMPCTTGIIFYA